MYIYINTYIYIYLFINHRATYSGSSSSGSSSGVPTGLAGGAAARLAQCAAGLAGRGAAAATAVRPLHVVIIAHIHIYICYTLCMSYESYLHILYQSLMFRKTAKNIISIMFTHLICNPINAFILSIKSAKHKSPNIIFINSFCSRTPHNSKNVSWF